MKTYLFKILAFGLLIYSVLGILLHLFFKLQIFGHYCSPLVLGEKENHLVLFTIAASLCAVFFSLLKRKKRGHKSNLPKP